MFALPPGIHSFTHEAMATTFEVLIAGGDRDYARRAANAVFAEIKHLQKLLDRFDPCSDISQINRLGPGRKVRISLDALECLHLAAEIWRETGGALDPTYRSPGGSAMKRLLLTNLGNAADDLALEDGELLEPAAGVVPCEKGDVLAGVEVDLGAIGKGYALDRVVDILGDWDIESALLNAGDSTLLALGAAPGEQGWRVGVGGPWGAAAGFDTVMLCGMALSGSGKEIKGEHVIDPRTGKEPQWHHAAWAMCPSAARADALSTAFLVMSTVEVEGYCSEHPEVSAMVVTHKNHGGVTIFGPWPGA